jgi:hypothetical protein
VSTCTIVMLDVAKPPTDFEFIRISTPFSHVTLRNIWIFKIALEFLGVIEPFNFNLGIMYFKQQKHALSAFECTAGHTNIFFYLS